MGWVGVAVLIATACFVLYHHPPRSWIDDPDSSSPPPRPQPEPISETNDDTASGGEDVNARRDVKPVQQENGMDISRDGDDGEDEEQTTPKASASTAPILQVPTFSLEEHDSSSPTPAQSSQKLRNDNHDSNILLPSPSPNMNNQSATMPPPPPPSSSNTKTSSASSLMPPPATPPRLRPTTTGQQNQPPQPQNPSSLLTPGRVPPRPGTGNSLRPPPSAASSLRAPPTGRSPMSNNSLAPTKVNLKPTPSSKRAVLEPGFSPLDWAALTANPNSNLRGANLPPSLIRVTPSMLKTQNGRKGSDAWTSYQGKVYNIQPYVPFHPGGKGELLRGAGKDSAKLFMEIHPWVNWDAILGECLVGMLVSENEGSSENNLDSMD